ncbi:hypothetical protein AALP_AA4G164500 [Arabis alpina]|uniref:Neprosin PEP catalytic domain-containing protein n=1 Tax=Arabis alpina TaxID=50452 RepID=A0A087H3P4_ARAAL|nr:hypothetical protein AALP_AA4G164500 [Arabis alpina]
MASPLVLIFSLSLLCLHGKYLSITPQEPEFECVEIYKQPSLQHLRLKNHQIQMRPSDEVLTMLSTDASSENLSNDFLAAEFDVPEEGCPKGQVPLHKPRNSSYTEKHFHSNYYDNFGEHAALIKKIEGIPWWRGASAWVGIYQPKVTKDQLSMVMLWLENQYNSHLNTIKFGWAVHPELYGDHRTRLTAYWSIKDSDDGCYNTICKGFVQVHSRVFLGATFRHTSVVGGDQYNVRLAINQDPKTQNWLLTTGKDFLGYWPNELLPYLIDGAKEVRWFM